MLALGTLALIYVLFAASSKPEPSSGLSRFATGSLARLTVLQDPPVLPSRTLRDGEGRETTLSALMGGEVSVVNLWATWCAPCMTEMPTLGALQRRFAGRVRVIPVSADEDAKAAFAQSELARLSQGALPFAIDSSRGILFDLQAPGLPVTILYDAQGRELARVAGEADWDSPEAAALIEAALAGEL
jgi:thiol-disulfide isomerase/thioredoxin